MADSVNQQIQKAKTSNQRGSISGNFQETITASLKIPMDYRRILSQFRACIISQRRKLPRMKPNRRYGFEFMGSQFEPKTHLLVAVDVSGSIATEDLQNFFSIINRFFSYGVETINVIAFDTEIKQEFELKKAAKNIQITGRGGTDFQCAIDYYEAHPEFQGMIIFTDGYADVPKIRKAKQLLWILTGKGEYDHAISWIKDLRMSKATWIPSVKRGAIIMVRRRRWPLIYRPYDENMYLKFGEQPYLFEIQLGYGLIPLAEKEKGELLLNEITYSRNLIDTEYGIPLPPVHIRDNMCLSSYDYSILFNGVEAGKNSIKLGYQLCLDTGSVKTPLEFGLWEKTKDPAFEFDYFLIPDEEEAKYSDAGYVGVSPERIIGTHLTEIIRKNRTRILNQNLVNTLVEKVREHLSYSFIQNYLDENKVLHVFRVSEKISQLLADKMYVPTIKEEFPYAALEPEDRRIILNSFSISVTWFNERNLQPVMLCVSDVRQLVFGVLHREMPGIRVVSDKELLALGNDITIEVGGDVTIDD